MPATLRHLTAADLQALLPTMKDWVTLVEDTLRQLGAADGGASAPPPAGGAPSVALDAQAFAIARDAACTAVAAKYLADPKSEVLTLLGGDRRGRAIVEALVSVFPNMERMLCFDPDVARQEQFADEIMTQLNLASIIPPEPREATEGANILVLNLPQGGAWPSPVIEADWLQKGTLVVSLHPGAGLTPSARKAASRLVTDNLAAYGAEAAARFPGEAAPDAELAAIVAGRAPGRGPGNPLVIHLVFGSPALDAALSARILQLAEQHNRGALRSA